MTNQYLLISLNWNILQGIKAIKKILILSFFLINFPVHAWILNNPYPEKDSNKKIYYSSFSEQPKTLDPARSYSTNEYIFISQIYEPVLQYDYYKRPYELIPSTATKMPKVRFLDQFMHEINDQNTQNIAYSVYTIKIRQGIFYQPHPAFAKTKEGKFRYLALPPDYLKKNHINTLFDFKYVGSRELIADDYIYEIKRLANPAVSSSINGLMGEHILGFREFGEQLPHVQFKEYIDLRKYDLSGVKKIDDYTFEIVIKGRYPQFIFWLAMPFFAPVPWEADLYYSQPEMDDKNLSFDWYPIGTGPFMLSENNPNKRMILQKNPNFREEIFPFGGSLDDQNQRYNQHAGKRLPLIDEVYFSLEKESIPRWAKFMQGYYDTSAVTNENYDETIHIDENGNIELTTLMKKRKVNLQQTIDPSVYYWGFNMLDNIVGGYSQRAQKLRQAISIAVDYDEFITLFYNGRGQAAQGPIPPGIFGYREGKLGVNPYLYQWDEIENRAIRRKLSEAKQLMREAGYANGIDPATRQPLILHYDVAVTGGPDDKAQLDWMRKQFAKIGIDLNIRATQYNRFQEKMRTGNTQIFSWGWNADYPDPENFLFQLYSGNGKVHHGGENASNYNNPSYDLLFEQMKSLPNGEKRQQVIDKMVALVQQDAPWIWGVNTESLILSQSWVSSVKPNTISLSTLKYFSVDPLQRSYYRKLWNQPIVWPIFLLIILFILLTLPVIFAYFQKERNSAQRMIL